MRDWREALGAIGAGVLVLFSTVLAGAQIGPGSGAGSQIPLPLKRWVALEMPDPGKGPTRDIKHVTAALNPKSGRIYLTGGDYFGPPFADSYRQETWSVSLAERWAGKADRNAGWRLEYPYCGPKGRVQPKHADFVGWLWDSKRSLFWLIPGTMFPSNDLCEGETTGPADDSGFLFNHLMTFDPSTRQWSDMGRNIGSEVLETWMSVYDPVRDEIIRFGFSGGSGGVANVLNLGTGKWERVGLGANGVGKDIRISKEYLALDAAKRVIYAIDGVSGRLHRFQIDKRRMDDLGPVPGGPHGVENYMYVVWDSLNDVLLWYRESPAQFYAYHPDAKSWERLEITSDLPGINARGRVMVFDVGQNAVLLFGGVEPANPHLFLYRYGPGGRGPKAGSG